MTLDIMQDGLYLMDPFSEKILKVDFSTSHKSSFSSSAISTEQLHRWVFNIQADHMGGNVLTIQSMEMMSYF